jgi:endonuclease/exonuclease/phosphatase family metal-dependent hydrolase
MKTNTLLTCAFAASAILHTGCSDDDTLPVGDDPQDKVALKDTALAHIGDALGDGNTTLEALFALDDIPFTAAPDPTALLTRMNTLDDARPTTDKATVSVLSYNVGLLDVEIFGFIDYARTPTLDERRAELPALVFGLGVDVLALQEVWEEQDVSTFQEQGTAAGYLAFVEDRSDYNSGTMMFVRKDLVKSGTTPAFAAVPYSAQVSSENFPGEGWKRGYISVRFEHKDVGVVHVFDTHMAAFSDAWKLRMRQSRELGIAVRDTTAATDLVVVTGDLNAGPYYASDEWKAPEEEVSTGWFDNAISYAILLQYGGLVDAAIMGRPAGDAIADVTLGKTVQNDPAKGITVAGVDANWCQNTPQITFTGTDCNSLYFQQYAATEFPARLDHVHLRDRSDVFVSSSAVVLTEQLALGGITIEPSDHYGVQVEFKVNRVP